MAVPIKQAFRSGGLGLAAFLSVTLAQGQAIRLTGRVLDQANLKPVPGALVRLSTRADAADTTGPDGRFSIIRSGTGLRAGVPAASFTPLLPYLGRDVSGRWRPWAVRLPSRSAGPALGKPGADRLDISVPGLRPRSLDLASPAQDLGDVVLAYPEGRLGVGAPPIYGAIPLFDGTRRSLDAEWQHWMGTYRLKNGLGPTPITWTLVEDPVDSGMTVRTCCRTQWGDEDLVTKRKFRDFQAHIEFNLVSAPRVGGTHPGPANSGVYLQSLYEIQVRDDYGKATLGNHDAGAILNEFAAPVNLCKPRGQWQAYDITFRAARFDAQGRRIQKAKLTLHWNGVRVHTNRETANEHAVGISSDPLSDGPKGLKLQSEGHDVRFRNVWVKELDLEAGNTDLYY